jgi:hypothetical protein
MSTLLERLRVPLPNCPPMLSSAIAASTRGATVAELVISTPLESVIVDRYWVHDMIPYYEQMINNVRFNPTNDAAHDAWFNRIDPAHTLENLTPVIVNEMDSSQWFMNVICSPALAVVRAIISRTPETNNHYFICSAPANAPIPDRLFYSSIAYQPNGSAELPPTLKATLELKTPNSLKPDVFDFLRGDEQMKSKKGSRYLRSIKFWWPWRAGTGRPAQRLIVQVHPISPTSESVSYLSVSQVWAQMVSKNVNYALLSSYDSTIFFHRRPNERTLAMSKVYRSTDSDILIAMISFLANAAEPFAGYHARLADTSFWPAGLISNRQNREGFDERCVFLRLRWILALLNLLALRVLSLY